MDAVHPLRSPQYLWLPFAMVQGLGGRRYIGFPKQPTITLCTWVNGLYETRLVRQDDRLASPLFPSLTLTAAEIFQAAA
jgi:Uma2 family endonuclease